MRTLSYTLLDVFTKTPFGGNQLAVFHNETDLRADMMQKIARELNLSECAFVFKPTNPINTKKLRIFTPQMELPMAGHPTIGTAYTLAEHELLETTEGSNQWTFEENVGEIPVTVHRKDGHFHRIEMEQPLPVFGEIFSHRELAASLLSIAVEELDPLFPVQSVSAGVPFLFIPVRSLAAMKKINFRTDVWQQHFSGNPETQHIFAFTTETENPQSTVHSRMFAPAMGITEDPATGAASGPLGAYLLEHKMIPENEQNVYSISSEQGFEMGRPSQVDISIEASKGKFKKVSIGGNCVIIGKGEIYLPEK